MTAFNETTPTQPTGLDRRQLLKGLGLLGAGALLPATSSSADETETGSPARTRLVEITPTSARLTTEGLYLAPLSGSASIGACLIVPGGGPQSAGPLQPLLGVRALALDSGTAASGPFEEDSGVAAMVRSLTRALDLPRPVTLHAFSSRLAGPAGQGTPAGALVRLDWDVDLRVGQQSALAPWLAGFHAWLIGELASDGTFRSLSFATVPISG